MENKYKDKYNLDPLEFKKQTWKEVKEEGKKELTNVAFCIAEFIDNSIGSAISNHISLENVSIKITINIKENSLTVIDNCFGMDPEVLKYSIAPGNVKHDHLGEHGKGLKIALLWLGNEFIIESKIPKEEIYGYWILKENMNDQNAMINVEVNEVSKSSHWSKNESGTIITINNLDKIDDRFDEDSIHEMMESFKYRYFNYIQKGVKIIINFIDQDGDQVIGDTNGTLLVKSIISYWDFDNSIANRPKFKVTDANNNAALEKLESLKKTKIESIADLKEKNIISDIWEIVVSQIKHEKGENRKKFPVHWESSQGANIKKWTNGEKTKIDIYFGVLHSLDNKYDKINGLYLSQNNRYISHPINDSANPDLHRKFSSYTLENRTKFTTRIAGTCDLSDIFRTQKNKILFDYDSNQTANLELKQFKVFLQKYHAILKEIFITCVENVYHENTTNDSVVINGSMAKYISIPSLELLNANEDDTKYQCFSFKYKNFKATFTISIYDTQTPDAFLSTPYESDHNHFKIDVNSEHPLWKKLLNNNKSKELISNTIYTLVIAWALLDFKWNNPTAWSDIFSTSLTFQELINAILNMLYKHSDY